MKKEIVDNMLKRVGGIEKFSKLGGAFKCQLIESCMQEYFDWKIKQKDLLIQLMNSEHKRNNIISQKSYWSEKLAPFTDGAFNKEELLNYQEELSKYLSDIFKNN